MTAAVRTRTELRVYLPIAGLRRQFAAYLGTPTRARGYPAAEGDHALIVEVAPGLAIERVTDLALRAEPSVEPGILFVERQFGVLEVHSPSAQAVRRAGQAILDGLGRSASDQLRPRLQYSDIIEDVTDQQAVIINRSRQASMLLPGQSLLVCERPGAFVMWRRTSGEAAPENTRGCDDDRSLRLALHAGTTGNNRIAAGDRSTCRRRRGGHRARKRR
jgi:hypothetical protein